MPTKLSDIDPAELSLVHRGAVRRPFFLTKADDEQPFEVDETLAKALAEPAEGEAEYLTKTLGDEAEPHEIALAAAEYRLAKARATEPEPQPEPSFEEIAKADFTAEQRRQMASNGQAMPDGSYPIPNRAYLEKAIHAVGRGDAPHADIRAHIVKRARALGATDLLPDSWNIRKEDEMPKGTGAAVPIKKDDGTWDLSNVSEEGRAAVEAVLKAHDDEVAELRKTAETEASKAEEALKIAKAEQDRRLTAEYIAKAEELGQPAEFGDVLKTIAGSVEPETFEKLEAVLKAANERAETAGLYAELGVGPVAKTDAETKVEARAAEIRKADPGLSAEQAYVRALDENPDLYDRMEA